MNKIIQIATVWSQTAGANKPVLFGLDESGETWVWDWFSRGWIELTEIDAPDVDELDKHDVKP